MAAYHTNLLFPGRTANLVFSVIFFNEARIHAGDSGAWRAIRYVD